MGIIKQCVSLVKDTRHTRWMCPLLFLADAAMSVLIVLTIPYTEIDWKTYMQQIALYIDGERDYSKLQGDTGPLVYPAGHVYIYRLLFAVTGHGENIALGQFIFVGLYLATLALVMLCYRQARVPPYVFPLLILSKRLHSIFLLRLFNDCFAVFFLFLAIHCYQKRLWTLGSAAYSIGVAVKMSLLLPLPAIGVMLWQSMGRSRALNQAAIMGQLQILLAYPFIASNPWSYVSRAFEFTRKFLFKWTVNWRFVGEDVFMSPMFSGALLATHITLLGLLTSTRWLHVPWTVALRQLNHPPARKQQSRISGAVSPDFILTSILSALIIGCLCARSLHYQFYVYIAWCTPFLLWRSGLFPPLIYVVWAAQEWAWNVYPSSTVSSILVVGCLQITLLSVWLGTDDERLSNYILSKANGPP